MNPHDRIFAASPAAVNSAEKLYTDITTVFPGLAADFNKKWTAWTKPWSPDEKRSETPSNSSVSPLSTSSGTYDRCNLVPEHKDLWALGPKIIPLVVHKLASEPQNVLGVHLYNELESDENYLVNPEDPNYLVLQRQAIPIVDMNYDRNKLVQAIHSSSAIYTQCDKYDKLLELGWSITAHLMLAYSREQTGFWFELMHEIVNGKKMGLWTIKFKEQYTVWNGWFQEMEHSKAPRWIQGKWIH